MTGSDFIRQFAVRANISTSEAYRLVKIYQDLVVDSLTMQEKITFIGYGIFSVSYKQGRKVKSNFSGDMVEMEPGFRPSFKFSKSVNYKVMAANKVACISKSR